MSPRRQRAAATLVLVLLLVSLGGARPLHAQRHGGHRGQGGRDSGIAAVVAGSAHRELGCRRCHSPRRDEPAARCAACHELQATEVGAGVHDRKVGCVACHGSHDVRASGDPSSMTHFSATPALCGACHASAFAEYRPGVHGQLALEQGDSASATCTSCHDAHGAVAVSSPAFRRRENRACATCHAKAFGAWSSSAHAEGVADGVQETPGCGDCHDPHTTPLLGDSPAPLDVSDRCGGCHSLQRTDYLDSFHGLEASLGNPRAASCLSCHTTHAALAASDGRSSVAQAQRGDTCGACHEGAGPAFATGAFHHDSTRGGHRLVSVVRSMYVMMIVLVIGLMLLHNAIDFRRRWIERRSHRALGPQEHESSVLRFTRIERLQHWLLAGSFLTLVATGFALHFGWAPPGLDGARWAELRRGIHRGAAAVFTLVSAYHVAWLIFTRRGRMNLRAILPRIRRPADVFCCAAACLRLGPPTSADWQTLWQMVRYNLGRRSDPPAQGRFTYAEKMEYFALVWGGLVMVSTGLALWFMVPFLNVLPTWLLHLAGTVHRYEAILATLAIVVWHFYFTMFNPHVFPLSRAMVSGRISEAEAKRDHPLEPGPDSEGPARPEG